MHQKCGKAKALIALTRDPWPPALSDGRWAGVSPLGGTLRRMDALSSLFCFVFFFWLHPSPGSSLALPGILMDVCIPWFSTMLCAHRTETIGKGMDGIRIAPSSRFPWAKGVAGPHGVFDYNWSVKKFWCPGQKVELKKNMIYESIHEKIKAQMLEFESWYIKACAAAKDWAESWKEQRKSSIWKKKISSMHTNWLTSSEELRKILSGSPGEILLVKLNSIS